MIGGISSQSDWWAQTGANRPPSIPAPGQANDSAAATSVNPAPAGSGAASTPSVAGGSTVSLSDRTSLALMVFGGAGGHRHGGSAAVKGDRDGDKAGPTGAATSSVQGSGQSSGAAKLFADLNSLFSTLAGSAGAAAGSASQATSASASPTGSNSSTSAGSAGNLSSTMLQDLQTISSDLTTIASASGTTQTGTAGAPRPGSPPTADDDASDNRTGATKGWNHHRQFAMAAYSAGGLSSLGTAPASSSTSVSA